MGFAFVVPRFGEGIVGGAERLVGELARALRARGDRIEIWTTCAVDNRTWENTLPEGESVEGGVVVRRFKVDARDLDLWVRHQISISEGMRLSVEQQLDWMAEGVNSSALYQYIRDRESDFDAIFFAPYLFGTTFFGALSCPQKALLIPCLHDECYAYLEIMRGLFRGVRGALFNSAPERELAQELYGAILGGEVGMGFESDTDEAKKPYFKDDFPYLLYLGRKETGKGVHTLIDHFLAAQAARPSLSSLRLVICGGGSFSDLNRGEALANPAIVDLEHINEEEKQRLISQALILVQPSVNESFSIVIMESWLRRVPVLVNSYGAVTRDHVQRSGGGLYYSTADELGGVLEELLGNPALRAQMAEAGFRYVKERYCWTAVLARFDRALLSIGIESSYEG